VSTRELVDHLEPDVVSRLPILAAWIPEPHDQEVERRGLVTPTEDAHDPS
jgi:hypothetical protein